MRNDGRIVTAFTLETVNNGLTPFISGMNGTVADISSATPILSGPRIRSQGNLSTDNNYIVATIGIAALPQYFTPNTDFRLTITLAINALVVRTP